jgi:hypothetical protein
MAQERVYLVECQDCKRQVRIDLTEMAERLDVDPLEWLDGRLKCKCGSTQFAITPYWRLAEQRLVLDV